MDGDFLIKLQRFCRDISFQDFCKIVYPDFKTEVSAGYLHWKYMLFQRNFLLFISDLDPERLARLAEAIKEDPG